MASVNLVVLEGNLTKSAELRYWNNNSPWCSFTIANNEYYKDEAGNYKGIPSFFDCVLKGKYGESMSKHLLKGRRVTVTGRLKQQTWTDEQGQKRSRVVIKVSELSLGALPSENKNTNYSGQPSGAEQQNYNTSGFDNTAVSQDVYSADMFDNTMNPEEEIPF